MDQSQTMITIDDPFSQHVIPTSSSQMQPPTGVPTKRKRKQEVLEEELYVDALSHIIERDYFPQLAAAKKNANNEEPVACEIDGLTVDSFFERFTSYDNASFEELQQKSVKEHRRKHAWLYELPPDEFTGKQRQSGMMMLYYLGDQVISAEQREKMDSILNGPENVGDNRPNGSQPGRFRVRNQLMFPPELSVSEDICRMHEDVSNATHAATTGASGNLKSILPGQQVPHSLMITEGEAAAAEGRIGGQTQLIKDGSKNSLNNLTNNMSALQQALVRYNSRLASGNQNRIGNEKVIQRSNTSLPAASLSDSAPALTAAQLLSWERSQRAKNNNMSVAARRFPGLVLEEPHTPSLRSSAAETGSCSSGSVAGDGASECADVFTTAKGVGMSRNSYPGGYMHKVKDYQTVPMSPCPVPGEGALQSMTPLFTWGSVEGTPVLLERFGDDVPTASTISRSHSSSLAGSGGNTGLGDGGAALLHDRDMKELQERALWEEEKGLPRFSLRPTTQRELLARSMDSKNQQASSSSHSGSSRSSGSGSRHKSSVRPSSSTGGRQGLGRTPYSERSSFRHTPKHLQKQQKGSVYSSTAGNVININDDDDAASVAQRKAYYAAAAASSSSSGASVAGSTTSKASHRYPAGYSTQSSLSAKDRLARLTPAARALAQKLQRANSTPLL